MRIKLMALAALLFSSVLVSGCVVVPGGHGYRHHHYYHNRY